MEVGAGCGSVETAGGGRLTALDVSIVFKGPFPLLMRKDEDSTKESTKSGYAEQGKEEEEEEEEMRTCSSPWRSVEAVAKLRLPNS